VHEQFLSSQESEYRKAHKTAVLNFFVASTYNLVRKLFGDTLRELICEDKLSYDEQVVKV